jgi:AcrR family transcriptional regulator
MRTTQEETQRVRQRIIDTAIEVFSGKGYDAANMQDIADRAGISRGPLYYHFKSKNALFHEAVKAHMTRQLEEYRRIFSQDKPILDLIREDLRYCTQHLRTGGALLIVPNKSGVKRAYALYEKFYRKVHDVKMGSVKQAIRKGELRGDANPQHIVNMMFVFYEGLYTATQVSKLITSVEEIDDMIESLVILIGYKFGAGA